MNQELNSVLSQLQTFAAEQGPQAIELAVKLHWWRAVEAAAWTAMGLIISILFYRLLSRVNQDAAKKNSYEHKVWGIPYEPFLVVGTAFEICVIFFTLLSLLSPWTWISLFNPRLGLAHEIYLKLLN